MEMHRLEEGFAGIQEAKQRLAEVQSAHSLFASLHPALPPPPPAPAAVQTGGDSPTAHYHHSPGRKGHHRDYDSHSSPERDIAGPSGHSKNKHKHKRKEPRHSSRERDLPYEKYFERHHQLAKQKIATGAFQPPMQMGPQPAPTWFPALNQSLHHFPEGHLPVQFPQPHPQAGLPPPILQQPHPQPQPAPTQPPEVSHLPHPHGSNHSQTRSQGSSSPSRTLTRVDEDGDSKTEKDFAVLVDVVKTLTQDLKELKDSKPAPSEPNPPANTSREAEQPPPLSLTPSPIPIHQPPQPPQPIPHPFQNPALQAALQSRSLTLPQTMLAQQQSGMGFPHQPQHPPMDPPKQGHNSDDQGAVMILQVIMKMLEQRDKEEQDRAVGPSETETKAVRKAEKLAKRLREAEDRSRDLELQCKNQEKELQEAKAQLERQAREFAEEKRREEERRREAEEKQKEMERERLRLQAEQHEREERERRERERREREEKEREEKRRREEEQEQARKEEEKKKPAVSSRLGGRGRGGLNLAKFGFGDDDFG